MLLKCVVLFYCFLFSYSIQANNTLLHFLVENQDGDISAALNQAINIKKISVDSKDKDGHTALHIAAIHGKTTAAHLLLTHFRADINGVDDEANTPIMLAANSEKDATVRELWQHKPNLEMKNSDGATLLHIAAARCNLGLCTALLATPINTLVTDNLGFNALHYAALNCDDPKLVNLLANKIDINARPSENRAQKAINLAIANHKWANAIMLAQLGAKYGSSTKKLLKEKGSLKSNEAAVLSVKNALKGLKSILKAEIVGSSDERYHSYEDVVKIVHNSLRERD